MDLSGLGIDVKLKEKKERKKFPITYINLSQIVLFCNNMLAASILQSTTPCSSY
jgi:hypothetical protein